MPTILDLVKVPYPATYQGNKIQPLEGVSLRQAFLTGKQDIQGYQFWEHSNKRAVTKGKWKAVSKIGTDNWELYDILTRTSQNQTSFSKLDKNISFCNVCQ
ncbi:MAG TPA: hypothetical protein P5236_01020 [Paludibacteraceae bacterium]|nr:hypothetical protein [Paludibacteraceae bacterium]HPO67872.1 hypothetical protein [Paludibacteraceae bacterium]HRU62977.1 hypothetical protein [Paludibacteraceae bacterium]